MAFVKSYYPFLLILSDLKIVLFNSFELSPLDPILCYSRFGHLPSHTSFTPQIPLANLTSPFLVFKVGAALQLHLSQACGRVSFTLDWKGR
jgi:hypothetical protein